MTLSRRHFLKLGVTSAVVPAVFSSRASAGTGLELEISRYVKDLRNQGRIGWDERTAWSVYDFTLGQQLVAINQYKPLQCASMIKPFVVLAYFYLHQSDPYTYPYNERERSIAERMIRHSSNSATNEMMRMCGGPWEVKRILQAQGMYGQLSFVEYIPKGGRTYLNRASAQDYQDFLYALWHKQMPMAWEMARLMSLPNGDRLKKNTAIPETVNVFDKTGSTAMMCGNMGNLEVTQYPTRKGYSFIGMIEKEGRAQRYGRWISSRSKVMREISEIVYFYYAKEHNLMLESWNTQQNQPVQSGQSRTICTDESGWTSSSATGCADGQVPVNNNGAPTSTPQPEILYEELPDIDIELESIPEINLESTK